MKKMGSLFGVGVVFDKDGTLLDTERFLFEGTVRALAKFDKKHDYDTHRLMMGAPIEVCLQLLHQKHPSITITKEYLYRKIREVREECGVKPMPGATRLLEWLSGGGIPIALATSARREETMQDLETMNWKRHFSAIVTAEDVKFHKPAPDVYLLAAQRLNLDPCQCYAFEDGVNGATSAMAAGMQVIFVRDDRFGLTPPNSVKRIINSLEKLVSTS